MRARDRQRKADEDGECFHDRKRCLRTSFVGEREIGNAEVRLKKNWGRLRMTRRKKGVWSGR